MMKNFCNIFLKTAAAALAVTLAAGCVFEKEGPSALTKDVMVLLDVNTSDMHTKAVEDPTDAEKKISTERIYAFDSTTGKQIGYADNDNKNDGKFHMVLQVPEGAAEYTGRFKFLQNNPVVFHIDFQFIPLRDIQSAAQFNGQNNSAKFIHFSDNACRFHSSTPPFLLQTNYL